LHDLLLLRQELMPPLLLLLNLLMLYGLDVVRCKGSSRLDSRLKLKCRFGRCGRNSRGGARGHSSTCMLLLEKLLLKLEGLLLRLSERGNGRLSFFCLLLMQRTLIEHRNFLGSICVL
jgi:hypothetical protein